MALFDAHKEFLLQPFHKGIRIVKPSKPSAERHFISIGDLFELPLIVFFANDNDRFVTANHGTLITNIPGNQGYYSPNDLNGVRYYSIFDKHTAKELTYRNNKIMHENKACTILEEQALRMDKIGFATLSFKIPVYNSNNKVMGILGICTITQGDPSVPKTTSISDALELIINTGLLPQQLKYPQNLLPGCEINGIYLTRQELRCLKLLITGKTIKNTAQTLNLSPRTVEHYLANVKTKMGVNTKSELIELIIQQLWPEISNDI